MDKGARKSAAAEWTKILKEHPKFARAFLAQQAILMEASELGYRLVDARMCRLLEMGVAVLFQDFWIERCKKPVRIEPGGVVGCVATAKNPADCFGIKHEDEWFDDPFAGGRTLPPQPPVPPLRP